MQIGRDSGDGPYCPTFAIIYHDDIFRYLFDNLGQLRTVPTVPVLERNVPKYMPPIIIIPPSTVYNEGISLKIIIAIRLAKIGSINVDREINVDE